MRHRALILVALTALPCVLSAQRIGRPRIFRRPEPPPAPLPPQPAIVANQLSYVRSRWSFEAAPLVSHIELPAVGGGTSVYNMIGTAEHGDFRINDHFAATSDVTASYQDSPALLGTFEIGARYRPLALDLDVRPYIDLRAGYTYMYDSFGVPVGGGGAPESFAQGFRYARGFGALGGAGFEYTLTRTLSLTTEIAAMRSRMNAYRTSGPAALPNSDGRYWMTAVRYTLGLKYNAVRLLHMNQATH